MKQTKPEKTTGNSAAAPKAAPKPKAKPRPKAKTAAAPKKVGRPSRYTPELAERICDLIATSDKGLERICRDNPELPNEATIRMWTWKLPEFHTQYLRAREAQQIWMVERAQAIADDGANDTYIDEEGRVKVDTDVIQRSRLRVETIKWQAGKLAPRRFGDKIDVNHGGQVANPLEVLFSQVSGTPFKPKSND